MSNFLSIFILVGVLLPGISGCSQKTTGRQVLYKKRKLNKKMLQNAILNLKMGDTLVLPSGVFKIGGKVLLKSDCHIKGSNTILEQIDDNKELFYGDQVENVSISNITFVGSGNYSPKWKNTESHLDRAINLFSSRNIVIQKCKFLNHALASIFILGCDNVVVNSNIIEGTHNFSSSLKRIDNYQFGIVITNTIKGALYDLNNISITNNTIKFVNQGIITTPADGAQAKNILIENNKIHDIIGQHGIYAETSNTKILNNEIWNIGLEGIKIQASYKSIKHVLIKGNFIHDGYSQGINITEISNGRCFIDDTKIITNRVTNCGRGLNVSGFVKSLYIDNLKINGTTSQYGIILRVSAGSLVEMNNVTISDPFTEGIFLNTSGKIRFSNLEILYSKKKSATSKAIKIIKGNKILFKNVNIVGYKGDKAIQIEPKKESIELKKVNINNKQVSRFK